MEPGPENARLVQRAFWLIRLRWVAAISVGAGTFFCSNVLGIVIQERALYGIAILLTAYNLAVYLLLRHFTGARDEVPYIAVKRAINFQMCADLLILTVLLHFSGGIENPLVFYFIFHMILASILLSVRESYLQATFAVLLFGLLVVLEYTHVLPHHCLEGFVGHCSYRAGLYILGVFFVFASTLYLVVYMASYISVRLKRAEKAHIQANTLLREKDRIKDEYVLRVTHDIKGHLATIQSCLGVVANGTIGRLDEQQADFVKTAHTRTKKLTAFVKTLLKLTQLRLNGESQMDVFSLRDTVCSAVTGVKAKARDKSITVESDIQLSRDRIYGNQVSVEEVITNLLLNAVKYTPENGTIAVRTKNENGSALVEISDTGIGIPEDELGNVFDEFFRASNARAVEKDGTGLGLSIAKHIVERHGGRIWVESSQNKGTKLAFTLPIST
ncbi:MAG: HAMP domain-containing histidine kinase [Phycisphaerales bacterium]|nr:MAG: HAMP domain-containing histidine kinase [Phycisphaerales bacterium]